MTTKQLIEALMFADPAGEKTVVVPGQYDRGLGDQRGPTLHPWQVEVQGNEVVIHAEDV